MTSGPMPVPSRTPISGRASGSNGTAPDFFLPRKVTNRTDRFFLNGSVSCTIRLKWRLQFEAGEK
jgi:hypothetical protein